MNLKFYTQTRRDNPEARLQKAILQHLKIAGVPDLIYFHPANEGRRSVVTGANLKALGMLPGVADLVIIRDGKAHFMEVKAEKGRLSDAQKEFGMQALKAGAKWAVVHSIDRALEVLRNWEMLQGSRRPML